MDDFSVAQFDSFLTVLQKIVHENTAQTLLREINDAERTALKCKAEEWLDNFSSLAQGATNPDVTFGSIHEYGKLRADNPFTVHDTPNKIIVSASKESNTCYVLL
jgi:hypothetical protein